MKIRGLITALVTPFDEEKKIDYVALEKIIERQIVADVDGICICGSTGEANSLTDQEREEFIKFTVNLINRRTTIVVGTGSNCTSTAKMYTQMARDLGADIGLSVAPYYNKPTMDGVIAHYDEIANVGLPTLVYNVPSRTITNLDDKTISRIKEIEHIIGIKEASGSIERIYGIQHAIENHSSSNFAILSGDDATMFAARVCGADGVISVISNIAPTACKMIQTLCDKGLYKEANCIQLDLYTMIDFLFSITNPIPVKYLLYRLGLIQNQLRLPLISISSIDNNVVTSFLELVSRYTLH